MILLQMKTYEETIFKQIRARKSILTKQANEICEKKLYKPRDSGIT